MKNFLIIGLVVFLSGIMGVGIAQTIENAYNFDDGSLQGFVKIFRYDDDPTVVTSDADFPAAFPPPSPDYVLRAADDDNTYYGLGSAVGGSIFDRTDSTFVSATLQAKIYIVESTATNANNFALIAIKQGSASVTEAYYRFGYRNGTVYFQKFNGASFTALGEDADLPTSSMTIPGWNTFTMEFVGASTINLKVNDVATSFSPVTDTESTIDASIQIGVLGFDLPTQNPILADDLYEKIEMGSSVRDWSLY